MSASGVVGNHRGLKRALLVVFGSWGLILAAGQLPVFAGALGDAPVQHELGHLPLRGHSSGGGGAHMHREGGGVVPHCELRAALQGMPLHLACGSCLGSNCTAAHISGCNSTSYSIPGKSKRCRSRYSETLQDCRPAAQRLYAPRRPDRQRVVCLGTRGTDCPTRYLAKSKAFGNMQAHRTGRHRKNTSSFRSGGFETPAGAGWG
mmetsp:Transcript_41308/g.78989  ORF Transcript_41308/g.78989 Transcript_41308/m.78989 type:complete len:205 (+) Transcript_41308:407-1021(+)